MQLADTHLRISKPKDAEYYNNLAFKKASKEKSTSHYYWILANDAIIKYQTKKHKQSIATCHEIEDYFISLNKTSELLTPYFYIGKNNYQLGELSEAIKYLEKVITISDEFKMNFSELKETHKFLHLSYTKIGNSEKASKHFIKYSDIDKKNDSTDISLNNRIHKEHDIVPLQEEINTLGTYTKYLYGSLIILALSLIGFFIWYKRKQQQNKLRFQKLLVTIETIEKPKEKIVAEAITTKEVSSPVTDENALQILKALEAFEEKGLYLRQDCTLGYVAKKLKTNTSYLSNVINTYKEKSFKSYLSELRINAALIQLKNDDRLRSYTINAIAEEFGFKRSETFSRAFKAQTDIYPSVYIKNLDSQQNK
jgi:AraC-like DNA-binding protein